MKRKRTNLDANYKIIFLLIKLISSQHSAFLVDNNLFLTEWWLKISWRIGAEIKLFATAKSVKTVESKKVVFGLFYMWT